ncbi:type IV pilin [Thiocystis violacea]|nr:GspH/FimT family pseudopilin [Thiocystis violacea]MBK1723268.1 type IV pilin [Thiocystis violacea]
MPLTRVTSRSRGLTLLELLVAIAVLAVLMSIAVPSMQSMIARNRLKAAAQAIAEDLRWARSESIKQNRPLQLSLDVGQWCYGVAVERPFGCDCRVSTPAPRFCELKRVSGADFPGVSLSATFTRTTFEPRRATAINGSLLLTSARGSSLKVLLSRLGRVRLCSPTGDLPGYDPCNG